MIRQRTFILCALVLLGVAPHPAAAQVSRAGDTVTLWTAPTRGSAIAYDPKSDVYLAVSAAGTLWGRFVTADGNPIGDPFVIQASGNYAHFPRVAYSGDADGGAGGFLVTWHESDQSPTSVHCRIVSFAHGLVSGDTRIAGSASFWEVGAAVAYASASQEFLIVWRSFAPADIHAARVNNAGAPIGAPFAISAAAAHEDHPNVTYNSRSDEFFVVHTSYTTFSTLVGQRVKAGQLSGGPAAIAHAAGMYMTDVSYDSLTGLFLAAWYQDPPRAIYGRLLHPDTSPAGEIGALSTRYRAYDAVSLAHNSASGTFFAISHDSITSEDGGVEIDRNGTPLTTGVQVTNAGGVGNFYPRIAAHASRDEWTAVASGSFSRTISQRIQTQTRGAGSTGPAPAPVPPPPPPPPAASNPRLAVDLPHAHASINGAVTIAGWAIDLGSPSGTGVDAVHVWAYPPSGVPVLVGVATLGVSRPDVGAAFGSSRFGVSGFEVTGALPAGAYDLAVFARSTVTGTFNNTSVVRVQVVAPASIPRMAVDIPVANQNVSMNFTVAGWALDLGTSAGTGVDAVHVWAYPVSGAAPIFVGVGSHGDSRDDVAAAFGSTRYGPSGFHLTVTGTLPRGTYDLAVFAHSSVTGTFNNASTLRITVN